VMGAVGITATAPAAAQDEVKLRLWAHQEGPFNDALQALIDAYTANHPNVSIEMETFEYELYIQTLQTAMPAGDEADIIELFGSWTCSYADRLAPAPVDIDRSKFFEATFNGYVCGDQVLGLPFEFNLEYGTVLVNQTMFESAGLAFPPHWANWDELVSDAQALVKIEDGQMTVAGYHFTNQDAIAFSFLAGILQRGGSIEIADTIVQDTQSEAVNLTRGAAIYLACGVGARLDDVTLVSNASAGLVVAGEDTRALGANLRVSDTGVHPSLAADLCAAPALMGAVQVRLGASAGFNLFTIRDNDVIGLLVAGEDAAGRASDATFRDGTIDRTGALAGDCAGGNNIMVIDSGELELGDFTCAEADLAGILLARDGEADLESGTVSSNLIGAAVQTVGFDLSRLQPRVRYVDNGRNLDATVLPIPDAAGDVGP
jgi:hypothetical protein